MIVVDCSVLIAGLLPNEFEEQVYPAKSLKSTAGGTQ